MIVCKLCQQSGQGPLVASQDGEGYIHAWGCPPINHHGQPCIRNSNLFCQEGVRGDNSSHKGAVCVEDKKTFCQETYCDGCWLRIRKDYVF